MIDKSIRVEFPSGTVIDLSGGLCEVSTASGANRVVVTQAEILRFVQVAIEAVTEDAFGSEIASTSYVEGGGE